MTEFGSFDNSTCKRVLDLLKPGDLTLGQVVIKRVAVVELGVNNGSGDGGGCFGIEVWTDTAKLISICYRHSNTSSCVAGQDQRSAVAIILTCMSVRVCTLKV